MKTTEIVEHLKTPGLGALAQIQSRPDSSNVHELEYFGEVMETLFKNEAQFKSKTAHFNSLVTEWQLHTVRNSFYRLRDGGSNFVKGKHYPNTFGVVLSRSITCQQRIEQLYAITSLATSRNLHPTLPAGRIQNPAQSRLRRKMMQVPTDSHWVLFDIGLHRAVQL